MLSSTEVLSTDEESSADEGDSDSELGKNLETLLRGKKTTAQLSFEQEEAERADLRRLLSEERPSGTPDSAETGDQGTILYITHPVMVFYVFSLSQGHQLV